MEFRNKLGVILGITISLFCTLKSSEAVFVNLKIYEQEWIRKVASDPLNNVNVRPTISNSSEPIEISVSLDVKNFEKIDDNKMEYSIQVTLRQEWEDDRLAYEKYNPVQLRQMKYLTLLEPEMIWRPDTIFLNEKSGQIHSVIKANSFARIYANGTVFYSARISLTLACPMYLKYFPFDSPICSLKLASNAFTRADLIYKWKTVPMPISVGTEISLTPEFIFDTVTSNYCDSQTGTGVHSCLIGEFHFHRSRSFYLNHNYIPVVNFVIIAWSSYLFDYNSERTLLLRGIICLTALSLAFIKISSISTMLPRTTYHTALDIWNGISLTFIFGAFVELILVHYLSSNKFGSKDSGSGSGSGSSSVKRGSKGNSQEDIEMSRTKAEEFIEPENFEVERKKSVQVQTTHWTSKLVPEKIEKWNMILYPCFYIGFNFIYWLVCSNQGESHLK